ncbi:hypothetical protein Nepgr_005529 [Nepenthes gracilis]|uniref:Uncharacterized protein n=1 Tax=Nepenthes gracilis TaxID=150966 RepID=A0AAD3XGI7_NEPGR|nr:hypothetical protein Nepgr_005529 [Nepenthes gracilis]
METTSEEMKMGTEQDRESPMRKKGGLMTMPFIIGNESFEKVASYGLLPNMILYLMKDYKMSVAKGTNLLFFWSAATNFTPLVGAFLADSFLGRFLTIALGSLSTLLEDRSTEANASLCRPPALVRYCDYGCIHEADFAESKELLVRESVCRFT